MKEDLMRKAGLGKLFERKKAGLCAICGTPIDFLDFKDPISVREYEISGMCQSCQDEFFKMDEDED